MRTIKFRGKRLDSGEWVYGDIVMFRYEAYITLEAYKDDGLYFGECIVRPDTVGQFTGLFDKNGKEIYEGDIVRSDLITPHEVFYDENTAKFMLRNEIQSQWVVAIGELAGLEVIGNVYDSPGLLKGGEL